MLFLNHDGSKKRSEHDECDARDGLGACNGDDDRLVVSGCRQLMFVPSDGLVPRDRLVVRALGATSRCLTTIMRTTVGTLGTLGAVVRGLTVAARSLVAATRATTVTVRASVAAVRTVDLAFGIMLTVGSLTAVGTLVLAARAFVTIVRPLVASLLTTGALAAVCSIVTRLRTILAAVRALRSTARTRVTALRSAVAAVGALMLLRPGVTLLIILTAIIRLEELTSSITLIVSTLRRIVANAIIAILSLLRLVHSLANAGCGVTVVRNVLDTTRARAGAR